MGDGVATTLGAPLGGSHRLIYPVEMCKCTASAVGLFFFWDSGLGERDQTRFQNNHTEDKENIKALWGTITGQGQLDAAFGSQGGTEPPTGSTLKQVLVGWLLFKCPLEFILLQNEIDGPARSSCFCQLCHREGKPGNFCFESLSLLKAFVSVSELHWRRSLLLTWLPNQFTLLASLSKNHFNKINNIYHSTMKVTFAYIIYKLMYLLYGQVKWEF